MENLTQFLETSYTAYSAVENSADMLLENGFTRLSESKPFSLSRGGKYFVVRGGSLIAFTVGKGTSYQIVASHTDSPALKLKGSPIAEIEGMKRLNVEPYGGGIYYSFFDRPLKIAGRIVVKEGDELRVKTVVSPFQVVIPSLAVHMNREVNDKFAPNPQIDLLPLLSVEGQAPAADIVSYDLYAVCAEKPFLAGANNELLCSPRIDNLTSVYTSLAAISKGGKGICVAACLNAEEIGSRTEDGAGGDFLRSTLLRISAALRLSKEEHLSALRSSFLISLDNAHALHPNHPEKCDITNKAKLGGGIVVKAHAGGAYTTDAVTSAVIKTVFEKNNVKYQNFFNRSDMRSGSTLGAISLGQASIPSVDLGLAQLAMHSAVETVAQSDIDELTKGLSAFYQSTIEFGENTVRVL